MNTEYRAYANEEIEVRFDAKRCLHAAECVKGLPLVFDVKNRPWIQPEHADADEIATVIEKCPSGALTYVRKDGKAEEIAPAPPTLTFLTNNLLLAHGEMLLQQGDQQLQVKRATLCGCGDSDNKPFCDNTHQCFSKSKEV